MRRQVWESSKSLKNALDHVEDIEDEDEPRILQEPIDELQVHIREGLKSKCVESCEMKRPSLRTNKLTQASSIASSRV